eukprot:10202909-Heterocapsa_arctica.AAC.1
MATIISPITCSRASWSISQSTKLPSTSSDGPRAATIDGEYVFSPAGSVGALSVPKSHIGSLVPSPAPAMSCGLPLSGLQQAAVA